MAAAEQVVVHPGNIGPLGVHPGWRPVRQVGHRASYPDGVQPGPGSGTRSYHRRRKAWIVAGNTVHFVVARYRRVWQWRPDPRCPRANARGNWPGMGGCAAGAMRRQDWCGCSAVTDSRGRRPRPGSRPDRPPGGVHPGFVRGRGVLVGDRRATVRPARADEVTGRDIWPLLLARAERQGRIRRGLAEAAAGRAWSGSVTLTMGCGGGQLAVHCEPLAGPGGGTLVIAQRAAPHPPGAAAARRRPGRHHAGPDPDRARGRRGRGARVRRRGRGLRAGTAARRRGADAGRGRARRGGWCGGWRPGWPAQPAAVTDSLLRPGEAFVFGAGLARCQAMARASPVRLRPPRRGDRGAAGPPPGGRETATPATPRSCPCR